MHASSHRGALAPVSVELQHPGPWELGQQVGRHRNRLVGRAVIDEDDLPVMVGDRLVQPAEGERQPLCLVVGRNHDRELRRLDVGTPLLDHVILRQRGLAGGIRTADRAG